MNTNSALKFIGYIEYKDLLDPETINKYDDSNELYKCGILFNEPTKPIQEFTSECFCIYTQSFKIENGDWVIVDGN